MLAIKMIQAAYWIHSLPFFQAIGPGSGVGHSSGAGSPFNNYMVGVAAYMFLIGVLVTTLLVGAFLIINIGLLSKRPEDRVGSRTPSDLGILRSNVWPEEPYQVHTLPAEEEDFIEEDFSLTPPPSPNELRQHKKIA